LGKTLKLSARNLAVQLRSFDTDASHFPPRNSAGSFRAESRAGVYC
jgi:hypothetical protein